MDPTVDESFMDNSSVSNDKVSNGVKQNEESGTESDSTLETEKEEMSQVLGAVMRTEIKDRICANSTCDQEDPKLLVAPSCATVYFGLHQSGRKTQYICRKCLHQAEEYRAVSEIHVEDFIQTCRLPICRSA